MDRNLKDAKEDDEVKVVIVTGAGRAFPAGANPKDLLEAKERFQKRGE